LLVVSAAALLTGCGVGDDLMTTMAASTSETAARVDAQSAQEPDLAGPSLNSAQPNTMTVTRQQRGYLDALKSAGVSSSNDLVALSIGSYVCQARAAKQSGQAMWDTVLPLVRGDVRTTHPKSSPPSMAEINSATADYIRIATERLC